MDRNSDGCVDINDFSLNGVISGVHYEKWREVRDKFDYDGDGQVTLEEVWNGRVLSTYMYTVILMRLSLRVLVMIFAVCSVQTCVMNSSSGNVLVSS